MKISRHRTTVKFWEKRVRYGLRNRLLATHVLDTFKDESGKIVLFRCYKMHRDGRLLDGFLCRSAESIKGKTQEYRKLLENSFFVTYESEPASYQDGAKDLRDTHPDYIKL